MRRFFGDLPSIGLSKVAITVFGLGYVIITARYLGPELNGLIATLMVYPSLFMTIGSLGIRQSTAFYVGKGTYEELSIKKAVVQLWYISSVLCIVSSYLLIKFFSSAGDSEMLIFLSIAPIPFTLFITYNSGVFLGKNEIKLFNAINWVPALIKFVAVILLVVVVPFSIFGALIAAIIAPFITSLILLKKNNFIVGFSLGLEKEILKALFSLGIVYAMALLIINLNYKLDVILLNKMSTDFETGIYSKGVQLIEYLWEIPMLLSTIVFARSANSKDNYAFSVRVTQLLRVSFTIVGFVCIVLIFISKYVIHILFGSAFTQSTDVLIYLLPGVLLLTVFKVLNMDLAGRGNPWISMKAMLPALVVNVVLNVLLIPRYGADGAAVASTISYSFAALLFLYLYSCETGLSIRKILNYSRSDFDPIVNFIRGINTK